MGVRLVENREARTPGRYALQEVLSHRGAAAAYQAISAWPGYAPTPLVSLDRAAQGAHVGTIWYKDESGRFGLGSFKALGGAYAVARLLQRRLSARLGHEVTIAQLAHGEYREASRGITVTTATDGNHGRSVAAGARSFGCRATIFIPRVTSPGREAAIRALGAEVVRIEGTYDQAVHAAADAATKNGWELVSDTSWSGYAEIPRDVMQGYTVMLIEVLRQLEARNAPPLTHVFIQGGVGGLPAAVCAHLWEAADGAPPVFIIVEPERADCLFQSALAGRPTPASGDLSTVMAGLACGEVSREAWRVLSAGARFFMTIDDAPAIAAMRMLARREAGPSAIIAGESATAGLAGLLEAAREPNLRARLGLTLASSVLVIGSEGATDPALYEKLVGQAPVVSVPEAR